MADEVLVNEMPAVLRELVTFVNRWPAMDCWRRARFAVTQAEIDAIREYFKHDGSHQFAWAVRGVALQVEEHPETAAIVIEPFHLAVPE